MYDGNGQRPAASQVCTAANTTTLAAVHSLLLALAQSSHTGHKRRHAGRDPGREFGQEIAASLSPGIGSGHGPRDRAGRGRRHEPVSGRERQHGLGANRTLERPGRRVRDVLRQLDAGLGLRRGELSEPLTALLDRNLAASAIGTRAFGADTALVARHAAAAVMGLQSAGVAACAKHFPGHGSTRQDSHDVIPTIDGPLSLVRGRDLPPFEAVIAAEVRAIMPSHLRIPELTGDLPASLSAAAQTGLLRGELGFTGLIVSDALDMRAVSEPYGIGEAAVFAVLAGTDLLCLGRDVDQATYLGVRDALVDAARSGRLPGERLEEAAARVAELRAWIAGSGGPAPAVGRPAVAGAGRPSHSAAASTGQRSGPQDHDRPRVVAQSDGEIGLAAARRAVLVSGVPLRPLHRPVVVQLVPPANIAVGSVPWGVGSWLPSGSTRLISTHTPAQELPAIAADVLTAAAGRSLLVVVRDAHRYPVATALVETLLAARPDAVIIEMGLPIWRPRSAATYLASYGAARSNALAVAGLLGLAAAD
jgi:beta-N-acetylhexosaminidase